jgi:U4/U6.U5 tri-snRNP-associated protein 1
LAEERAQVERRKWLVEQRKKDLIKEHEGLLEKERGSRGGRSSARRDFDRVAQREVEEKFKEYKPDIRLEYHDEFGRALDPKEVFPA